MSNINLYNLSNKIRTTLLTIIDKEILKNSKENHLLLNSQNQEQLMKKFINYRDFTIECEESFEGIQKNKDNSVFFDLSYNYSDNKFSIFCPSKTNNNSLFSQNFITKSFSPEKNKTNSRVKKIGNIKVSENDLIKKYSRKKIITEMESSFSSKKVASLKKSSSLSDEHNKKRYIKRFSADLYIQSTENKNDDISKLINYCYKLKKPNDEIINEISEDDTSKNKENGKNKIKNKHKNTYKKKLKKIINKKISVNKNSHSKDVQPLKSPSKKNSTNFTSQMKLYFDYVEKSNLKEKNQYFEKRLSNIELKKNNAFHWKNVLKLNHYNSKSPEKKSKGKKFERARKSFCEINNKANSKKLLNLVTCYKLVDSNSKILKVKEKKEKKDKKDVFFITDVADFIQFPNKQSKSSRNICKKNDEIGQNSMFCFGKKISKLLLNKRNESNKKNIKISNNNYNDNIIHIKDSIEKKQN